MAILEAALEDVAQPGAAGHPRAAG
jgi:hypothetical protein